MVARRSGKSRQDTEREVPETNPRTQGRSERDFQSKTRNGTVASGVSLQGETGKGPSDNPKWLKTVENCHSHNSSARDDSPTPIRKVSKPRNTNYLTSKKEQHLRSRPQAPPDSSGLAAPISKQPAQDDNIAPTPTLSSDNEEDSKRQIHPSTRPQYPQSDLSAARSTSAVLPMQPHPPSLEQPDMRTTILEGENRPSTFVWKSNQRSIHKIPPSTHLPEFEYRPAADIVNAIEDFQAAEMSPGGSPQAIRGTCHLHCESSAKMPVTDDPAAGKEKRNLENLVAPTTEHSNGSASKLAPALLNPPHTTESASIRARDMQPPSLSTQTSATSNTNPMPSAQMVSALQPPPAESYPSADGKMIEPEITPTDQKVPVPPSSSSKCVVPMTNERHELQAPMVARTSTPNQNGTSPSHTDNVQRPHSRKGIVPFSAYKSPPTPPSVSELDTQKMLAAITPLGFSTVKKVPFESSGQATPATATRAKPQQQKKRASFTPRTAIGTVSSGPSQGSIKGSLKVSKVADTRTKTVESLDQRSEPSVFGKLGLDMETSDEDGVSAEAESLLELSSCGEPQPQSAPATPRSLPRALMLASTGSVQEQDAQQQHGGRLGNGHDGEEGQEDFNLASAMDDLGSFLGTWDADKEAREFASVTSGSCVKSALKCRGSVTSVKR